MGRQRSRSYMLFEMLGGPSPKLLEEYEPLASELQLRRVVVN